MSLLQACNRATAPSRRLLVGGNTVLSRALATNSNLSPETSKKDTDIVTPTQPPQDVMVADVISGAPGELRHRAVRIYQPTRNTMQSGGSKGERWRIDFDILQGGGRWENPLMGWASSADYMQGTRVTFRSREDAIHFAEKQGWDYHVYVHIHHQECSQLEPVQTTANSSKDSTEELFRKLSLSSQQTSYHEDEIDRFSPCCSRTCPVTDEKHLKLFEEDHLKNVFVWLGCLMANILPDELIKEILTPALRVPDEIFSDTSPTSPFSTYSRSSSAFLVVSKGWLRVATPLLYHVVVLRSKAQAQALEAVLFRNPQLGTYIKKLRIEGGYGSALYSIIKSAPNVTDLFVSLEIWSSDSVSGLCRGLPRMNPTRVILHDPLRRIFNSLVDKLFDVLCECVKSWKRLEDFYFPYTASYQSRERAEKVSQALAEAPHLKSILLRPQLTTMYLLTMARNPSLRSIRMVFGHRLTNYPCRSEDMVAARLENALLKDVALRDLVQFEYPQTTSHESRDTTTSTRDPSLLSYSPSFIPLQSAPNEVKETVWGRAIYLAMLQEEDDNLEHQYFNDDRRIGVKLEIGGHHILQVSKMFYKLGVPRFYKCVIVQGDRSLERLADTLTINPSLGAHIRSLLTSSLSNFAPSNHLRTVLSHTPRLSRLGSLQSRRFMTTGGEIYAQGPVLNFQGLHTLASTAGATLLELTGQPIVRPSVSQSPAPLYGLVALRTLDWQSPAKFKFSPSTVPTGALANLERLSFASVSDSVLRLLGCMDLPALRHVSFPNIMKMEGASLFLKQHGPKLLSLETKSTDVFELCPALNLLIVTYASDRDFMSPARHTNLAKVVITKHVPDGAVKDHYKYLEDLQLALFPALQELRVNSCKWPTTEHDIKKGYKSNWVKWAEHLRKWNVKLTDRTGKEWVSRLKEK